MPLSGLESRECVWVTCAQPGAFLRPPSLGLPGFAWCPWILRLVEGTPPCRVLACLTSLSPWEAGRMGSGVGGAPLSHASAKPLPPGSPPRSPFPWALSVQAPVINQLSPRMTAVDGSPPGSPSLGFFRQEHWSRLPFPPLWSRPLVQNSRWGCKKEVRVCSQPCLPVSDDSCLRNRPVAG